MILPFTATCRLITYVMLMLMAISLHAQDAQFSQFYANPIYTNPAFAGTSKVGRLVLASRSQWAQIAGSYSTVNASYDEHFDVINGGIGIQMHYDDQGIGKLRTTGIDVAYSYQIPITKSFTVRAALQAGFVQKSIDFGKLHWFDEIIARKGFLKASQEDLSKINSSLLYPNFAAGILGYSKNFYAGFAAHNLTEPAQTFFTNPLPDGKAFIQIPMKYTANAGIILPLIVTNNKRRQANLYPNVIYMQQQQFNQLNLGLFVSRGTFVAGLYFRQTSINSDAFIFFMGLRTPKVKIGYSYDATVSEARYGAVNSHEVTLSFEMRKHIRHRKPRPMTCPDF